MNIFTSKRCCVSVNIGKVESKIIGPCNFKHTERQMYFHERVHAYDMRVDPLYNLSTIPMRNSNSHTHALRVHWHLRGTILNGQDRVAWYSFIVYKSYITQAYCQMYCTCGNQTGGGAITDLIS